MQTFIFNLNSIEYKRYKLVRTCFPALVRKWILNVNDSLPIPLLTSFLGINFECRKAFLEQKTRSVINHNRTKKFVNVIANKRLHNIVNLLISMIVWSNEYAMVATEPAKLCIFFDSTDPFFCYLMLLIIQEIL